VVIAWAICGYIVRRRVRVLLGLDPVVDLRVPRSRGRNFWELSQIFRCLQQWNFVVRGIQDGTIDPLMLDRAAVLIQRQFSRQRGSKMLLRQKSTGASLQATTSGRISQTSLRRARSRARVSEAQGEESEDLPIRPSVHVVHRNHHQRSGQASFASVHPISLNDDEVSASTTKQGLDAEKNNNPDAAQAIYYVCMVVFYQGNWKIWRRDKQPRKSIRRVYRDVCASKLFWRFMPWVVSISGLAFMTFCAFIYMMKYFAFDNRLFQMWMQTVGTSLCLAWFVVLPMAIIARNNMQWSKKIMKSRKYQILEKFLLIPLKMVVGMAYKTMKAVLG